jgi:hypothetical protein
MATADRIAVNGSNRFMMVLLVALLGLPVGAGPIG